MAGCNKKLVVKCVTQSDNGQIMELPRSRWQTDTTHCLFLPHFSTTEGPPPPTHFSGRKGSIVTRGWQLARWRQSCHFFAGHGRKTYATCLCNLWRIWELKQKLFQETLSLLVWLNAFKSFNQLCIDRKLFTNQPQKFWNQQGWRLQRKGLQGWYVQWE